MERVDLQYTLRSIIIRNTVRDLNDRRMTLTDLERIVHEVTELIIKIQDNRITDK